MDDSKKKKTLILNTLILLFCVVIITLFCLIPNKVKVLETYKVNFESEGGSEVAAVEIEDGQILEKPKDPTREGYIFVGWMLGDELYDFSKGISENITLRAEWKEMDPDLTYYTISFDTGGGTIVSDQIIEEGSLVERPSINPTRDNYEFAGWTYNGADYNFDTPVTGDMTIVARWNEVPQEPEEPEEPTDRTFTVRFNLNGGSGDARPQSIKAGERATRPSDPTRNGYRFNGWHLNSVNGAVFNFNTAINNNITLYAGWTANPVQKKSYIVRFEDEGGGQQGSAISVEENTRVPSNLIPAGPPKAHYHFEYWAYNGRNINSVTVTSDMTFRPYYTKQVYTVSCTSTSQNVNQSCIVNFVPSLDTNGISLSCNHSSGRNVPVTKAGNQFTTNYKLFQEFNSCTITIGNDTFSAVVNKN